MQDRGRVWADQWLRVCDLDHGFQDGRSDSDGGKTATSSKT